MESKAGIFSGSTVAASVRVPHKQIIISQPQGT